MFECDNIYTCIFSVCVMFDSRVCDHELESRKRWRTFGAQPNPTQTSFQYTFCNSHVRNHHEVDPASKTKLHVFRKLSTINKQHGRAVYQLKQHFYVHACPRSLSSEQKKYTYLRVQRNQMSQESLLLFWFQFHPDTFYKCIPRRLQVNNSVFACSMELE